MLVTRPGSDDLTHSLSLIPNLSQWSSKVESVGSIASLAIGDFLFGPIMENMREYNLEDCNKFVEHKIRQPSWLAGRWPVSVHVTVCLGLNFRTRRHSTLRKKEEKTKFWGRLVESVVFQSHHVGVPNQSCGSWNLFLCKRFLLFQEICVDAGHVSENALYVWYLAFLNSFESNNSFVFCTW